MTDQHQTHEAIRKALADRLEKEAARKNSAYDYYGMDNTPQSVDPLVFALLEAFAALLADRDRLAAEVQRLSGILTDHNADCIQQCEARKKAGRSYCPMQGYNRLCSDCPRDAMIDAAIAAKEPKP